MTDAAHAVTQETIDGVRAKGLSDEDVLDVVQVTGFFNYYNRMADALGVDPEDFFEAVSTSARPAPS